MHSKLAIALVALCCFISPAPAASLEEALRKIAPEERANQACILKGLQTVQRDQRLHGANRMLAQVFTPPALDSTSVTARGGAVRLPGHCYALSFSCKLTPDYMKALSFSYELGKEIPRRDWPRYYLWDP